MPVWRALGGAEIDEVNRVGRALRERAGNDRAWFEEWTRMGAKVEARGREAEGRAMLTARRLPDARRALLPDRRALPAARAALAGRIYKKAVKSFDGAAMLRRRASNRLRFRTATKKCRRCSCILRQRAGNRPAPAVVFFDGFDITKEIQYFKGVPDLAARGIACLIVDGPGNGESVRFRDMPLIAETEKYGTAAYEYLAGRPEVDSKRIGVLAISLGYYAPRAAAFEPRYAACIAWGAQWDYHATWKKRFDLLDNAARCRRFRCLRTI